MGLYAYNIFFLISQSSLARKAPVIAAASAKGVGQTQRRAGWRRPRLMGAQADGSRPLACCAGPSCRSHLFLLQQASWEIHLFQNKGTEIMHRRNVNVCIFAAIWTAAQIQTSGVRFSEPPRLSSAPAQARARAHQESCRTEDVTSAGEDRLTPM